MHPSFFALTVSPKAASSTRSGRRIAHASPIGFATEGCSFARLGRLCSGHRCRVGSRQYEMCWRRLSLTEITAVCPGRSVSAVRSLSPSVSVHASRRRRRRSGFCQRWTSLSHRCELEIALTRRRTIREGCHAGAASASTPALSSEREAQTTLQRAPPARTRAHSQPWARKRRDASN